MEFVSIGDVFIKKFNKHFCGIETNFLKCQKQRGKILSLQNYFCAMVHSNLFESCKNATFFYFQGNQLGIWPAENENRS